MAIPDQYDKKMKELWGMRAVWFPGSKVAVGDIVQKAKDGTFQKIDNLASFGIKFKKTKSEALKTGFKSASTKLTFVQAGVDVTPADIDADARASVKIEFTGSDSFIVAAPIGTIESMDNLLAVAGKIGQIENWEHKDWMVVRSVFTTKEFSVIGSSARNRKVEFSGDGKSVLDFATFGLTAGVKRESSSQLDVEFIGAKGALALDLARIKKNGQVVMG